jgi:hypothetical protein
MRKPGKRQCQKGKPCGATCIERRDICQKELGDTIDRSTGLARNLIWSPKASKLAKSAQSQKGNYFDVPEEIKGRSRSDLAWLAMAKFHKSGLAHNNLDEDHIFIDTSGKIPKATALDAGTSQKSYKAALAEGLGTFKDRRTGQERNTAFPGNNISGLAEYIGSNRR